VDFNVPIEGGVVRDTAKIDAALPTIEWLRKSGARIILLSHLGRPQGRDPALSMAPIVAYLAKKFSAPVMLIPEVGTIAAVETVARMRPGDIALVENVRYFAGEEENSEALSAQYAELGDIFVNDAFASSHRAHASVVGITRCLPSFAGMLLAREVEMLTAVLQEPKHPFVVVLGGSKVSTKLGVIQSLVKRADAILIGGAMMFTFLKAMGRSVGTSPVESALLPEAQKLLASKKIMLPIDTVVAKNVDDPAPLAVPCTAIPQDKAGYDIGPETVAVFREVIAGAKTVFWNGPVGLFEKPVGSAGTKGLVEVLANHTGSVVVGGGDTLAAVEQFGAKEKITLQSTGGGAALEFLEGKSLPGIIALEGSHG